MLTTQDTPSESTVGLISLDPSHLQPRRKVVETDHADYLNFPGLESAPDVEDKGKWLIRVKATQIEVPTYPDCDCLIKEVKPHSPFEMKQIHDVPRGRKRLIIVIKRRRWKCKSCNKTVTQPLDGLAKGHYRMTQRLLEYLEVQSLFETELSLDKETGVFVRTIREIREKFVERLEKEVKFDTPRVLGLDGVRADSRSRRVNLTDIEAGLVVDLIKAGNAKGIADRIREFKGYENIQFVTIDMCRTLRASVLDALPGAVIIIDLFHIMRIGNQVMDKARNRLFEGSKKRREPGQPGRPRPEPFRMRRAQLKERHLKYMEYWFLLPQQSPPQYSNRGFLARESPRERPICLRWG